MLQAARPYPPSFSVQENKQICGTDHRTAGQRQHVFPVLSETGLPDVRTLAKMHFVWQVTFFKIFLLQNAFSFLSVYVPYGLSEHSADDSRVLGNGHPLYSTAEQFFTGTL